MNNIIWILLWISIMLSKNVLASDTLTVRQMNEDIDYYFQTVEKIHPKLYERYSQVYFDSIRNVIKNACVETMSVSKFLYQIGLVNKLTDYHTGIDGLIKYNYNFNVIEDINFLNNKLYYKNLEILSINGIPADVIYHNTDGLVSWAYSEQERQNQLQRMICLVLEQYNIKGPFYQMIVKSDDKNLPVEIKGRHYDFAWPNYFQQQIPYLDTLNHEPVISMRFVPEDSFAVLYYNSAAPEDKQEIQRGIDYFFKKVLQKGFENIFIDVSMNGGGNSLLNNCIYKHLHSCPWEVKGKAYATLNGIAYLEKSYAGLFPKKVLEEFKDIARKGVKEFFERFEGNLKGYEGKVFVIMGRQTFSAGHDFCEMIKRSKKGILVGEATGQRSPYTATVIDFVLPHSKIAFTCGSYSYTLEPSIMDLEGFLQPDLSYPMNHPLNINDYRKIIKEYHNQIEPRLY